MQHDPRLYPPLDRERRDFVRAMIATIEARLRGSGGFPFAAARDCLDQLLSDNIAARDEGPTGVMTLTMFGIRITTRGTAYAALTLWSKAAKDRLARISEIRT